MKYSKNQNLSFKNITNIEVSENIHNTEVKNPYKTFPNQQMYQNAIERANIQKIFKNLKWITTRPKSYLNWAGESK